MISLRQLEVREGQKWNRELWRLLLRAVAERTIKKGPGIRLHHAPDGVVIVSDGGGGPTAVIYPWQMAVDLEQDETNGPQVTITFQRGLVNSIEGKIDDGSGNLTPMSQADPSGNLPKLYVDPDTDFDPTGISRIYAKCTLDSLSQYVSAVEMVSRADVPAHEAWTAYKLIGLVFYAPDATPPISLAYEQHCFFDQALLIANNNGGHFTPVWGVA